MEVVAACLLNATNATNATVVPEEPSDMYALLQRQCRIAPGLEFKNAYGTVQAMLFIALAVPTVLAFAEQSKRIAALAFERSSAELTKRIDRRLAARKSSSPGAVAPSEEDEEARDVEAPDEDPLPAALVVSGASLEAVNGTYDLEPSEVEGGRRVWTQRPASADDDEADDDEFVDCVSELEQPGNTTEPAAFKIQWSTTSDCWVINQPGGRPAPYRAAWHAPAAQAPEEEQAPLGAKWVAHEGGDGNETAPEVRAEVTFSGAAKDAVDEGAEKGVDAANTGPRGIVSSRPRRAKPRSRRRAATARPAQKRASARPRSAVGVAGTRPRRRPPAAAAAPLAVALRRAAAAAR